MARKRMLSLDIMDSDIFCELSIEARYLYCELTIRADDYGFVNGVKRIIKMTGCKESSLTELENAAMIIRFESGVFLIMDWLVSNKIQPSKLTPTRFEEEAAQIKIRNKRYELATEGNEGLENLIDYVAKDEKTPGEAWADYNRRNNAGIMPE